MFLLFGFKCAALHAKFPNFHNLIRFPKDVRPFPFFFLFCFWFLLFLVWFPIQLGRRHANEINFIFIEVNPSLKFPDKFDDIPKNVITTVNPRTRLQRPRRPIQNK